jgi:hypothetical protein
MRNRQLVRIHGCLFCLFTPSGARGILRDFLTFVRRKDGCASPAAFCGEFGDYRFIAHRGSLDVRNTLVNAYLAGIRICLTCLLCKHTMAHKSKAQSRRSTGNGTKSSKRGKPHAERQSAHSASGLTSWRLTMYSDRRWITKLARLYSGDESSREKHAPSEIADAVPVPITGDRRKERISTPHIERQNLTMKMQLRRFTRLTNAFSKKLSKMKAALALDFAHHNSGRVHQTLRVTPAMASSVTNTVRTLENLI